ncbi:hypothetical protein Q648_00856 [Bartonella quintana JK 12]|uniref:Uncharacterized protein n=2 Tax=Bartonella quintana TaxID=803 RepID=W3U0C1_BARQI|nr:hypothetical protein Q651_01354 [Bartonella quintana BQ2-D70]ETS14627.1 hypothetical protein Q650_01271 [Bartonella quintana JK 73rel]ETS16314.1 hypothetical protein Q649_01280 [Bartonella quintana JK 73]ETS18315.1 hypothetical protein Q647_01267 [Bartonella quintana JK 7]ETS19144.1 hypothetical protein Q648_00856 [Bartonella quintana JK 12]KEC60791.1 hypothetical protein O91_00973 [Bartonella quintana JK 31]KEC63846.1 hypothetical protein O7W_01319 [Bartonella quintana JK 56]KEC64274.1 h
MTDQPVAREHKGFSIKNAVQMAHLRNDHQTNAQLYFMH